MELPASTITLDTIGGQCPVQAEGNIDGYPFYFRARGDSWSVCVAQTVNGDPLANNAWFHCEPYGDTPWAAGWMSETEALFFLRRALTHWRLTKSER